MGEYTFKRAKIRKPETWTLSDTSLSRDGESITLSDVTEVMFEQAVAGRQWVTVFKLATGDKTHTLQCNDGAIGQSRQQFLALCNNTISQMATSGSAATVRQGKGAAIGGWMMVLAGLVFLFVGLFFIWSAFARGHGAVNFIIGGGAALLGAFFIKMGEPWKAQAPETLSDLNQRLVNIRAAVGTR